MQSNYSHFSRRKPDNITEEIVAALSSPKAYEFKALFLVIYSALQERKVATGGEEMLRLRTYDKLQALVMHGQVKRTGKKYKGLAKPLRILAAQLKEFRDNPQAPFPGRGADRKPAA